MKLVTILQVGALCLLALYGAASAKSSDAAAPCAANQLQAYCDR